MNRRARISQLQGQIARALEHARDLQVECARLLEEDQAEQDLVAAERPVWFTSESCDLAPATAHMLAEWYRPPSTSSVPAEAAELYLKSWQSLAKLGTASEHCLPAAVSARSKPAAGVELMATVVRLAGAVVAAAGANRPVPERIIFVLRSYPQRTFSITELAQAIGEPPEKIPSLRSTVARLARDVDGEIQQADRGRYRLRSNESLTFAFHGGSDDSG